jgi:enhancing lycopene biosynthesis protein 2
MKKIALIFAGCNQRDGPEIQKTVLSLLALNQVDFKVEAVAPDLETDSLHIGIFQLFGVK